MYSEDIKDGFIFLFCCWFRVNGRKNEQSTSILFSAFLCYFLIPDCQIDIFGIPELGFSSCHYSQTFCAQLAVDCKNIAKTAHNNVKLYIVNKILCKDRRNTIVLQVAFRIAILRFDIFSYAWFSYREISLLNKPLNKKHNTVYWPLQRMSPI